MADVESDYRELIDRTGLDPTLVREVEIRPLKRSRDGSGFYLRAGQTVTVPGHGRARFVREVPQSLPELDLPLSLEVGAYLYVPLHAPELAPSPETSEEYWQRAAALAAKAAPFQGRLHWSGGRERGWLPIVERAIDAIAAVIRHDMAVDLAMQEDFGSLNARAHVIGGPAEIRRFIYNVALWIEAAAVRRCMLLGIPGWRGPFGDLQTFDATLSDQARALDESQVWRLTYPRPQSHAEERSDEA